MYNTVLIPMDLEHEDMFPKAVALAQQLIGDENGEIHAVYVDQNLVHHGNFSVGRCGETGAGRYEATGERSVQKVCA